MLVESGLFTRNKKLVITTNSGNRVVFQYLSHDNNYIFGKLVTSNDVVMQRFGLDKINDELVDTSQQMAITNTNIEMIQAFKENKDMDNE